jgi:uncharacterized 2Fe-2S/4Fe-4S cluster protein (DUF4445 family)
MSSITLGVSPLALGVSPFVSPASEPLDITARDLGIEIMAGGNIHCLPSEAGFVGADNVAVLIAEEPFLQEKLKLIIDIGTNSEICLGNKDGLYVTSCATGRRWKAQRSNAGCARRMALSRPLKFTLSRWNQVFKIIGEDKSPITPVGICGQASWTRSRRWR